MASTPPSVHARRVDSVLRHVRTANHSAAAAAASSKAKLWAVDAQIQEQVNRDRLLLHRVV
eukprot:SAG31_NODE_4647_length_3070_cov_2.252777_3_plen_61_part_00